MFYYYRGNLRNKKIAIWGLAFKAETDDMREATSLVIIDLLLEAGATIVVYDPIAMEECKRRVGNMVFYATDMYDAVQDVDALLLLTEWKLFRLPKWDAIKNMMKEALVIDGRNIYDKKEMHELGFTYLCIGC